VDASTLIDTKIKSLADWRGKTLAAIRRIVHEAVPDVTEEWKWMGTPTWSSDGILCLANAHKKVVKVTFPKGAKLADPEKIFNRGLGGNAWRAIDFSEGDMINERALKNLIRAALAFDRANVTGTIPPRAAAPRPRRRGRRTRSRSGTR
jgi:hypothetical protein